MDVTVTWQNEMNFVGLAESRFPIRMSSPSGPDSGAGPVELTLMALAACTAMDVISILHKKKQRITEFQVVAHAERASTYPKVITQAQLEYVVIGTSVEEASVRRAIELSVRQYCPVHAMLSRAFPIDLRYSIKEATSDGGRLLVKQGEMRVNPSETETEIELT